MLRKTFAAVAVLLFAVALFAGAYAYMLGGQIDARQFLGTSTVDLEEARSMWIGLAAVTGVGGLLAAFVSLLVQMMGDQSDSSSVHQ